jgi:hypothetical protein
MTRSRISRTSSCERRRERRRERVITKVVLAGEFDARKLNDGHWRLWLIANPTFCLHYWPRTGEIQHLRSPKFTHHGKVRKVLKMLRKANQEGNEK